MNYSQLIADHGYPSAMIGYELHISRTDRLVYLAGQIAAGHVSPGACVPVGMIEYTVDAAEAILREIEGRDKS